jgi:hypothetical protein
MSPFGAHVVADDTGHAEGQVLRVFFSPQVLSTGPPRRIAASTAPESPVIAEKLPPNENRSSDYRYKFPPSNAACHSPRLQCGEEYHAPTGKSATNIRC